MPGKDLEQKVGELTAISNFTANQVCEVKRTLEQQNEVREKNMLIQTDFHLQVSGTLATLTAQVTAQTEAFNTYRADCNQERDELDERTKKLELKQSRQAGQVSMLLAIAVAAGGVIDFLLHSFEAIKGVAK